MKTPELTLFTLKKSDEDANAAYRELAKNYTQRQILRLKDEAEQEARAGELVNPEALFVWMQCLMQMNLVQHALDHLNQYNGHRQNITSCIKVITDKQIQLHTQERQLRPKTITDTHRAVQRQLKIEILTTLHDLLENDIALAGGLKGLSLNTEAALRAVIQRTQQLQLKSVAEQSRKLMTSLGKMQKSIGDKLQNLWSVQTRTESLGSQQPEPDDVKGSPETWDFQLPKVEAVMQCLIDHQQTIAAVVDDSTPEATHLNHDIKGLLTYLVQSTDPLMKALGQKREFSLKAHSMTVSGYSKLLTACQTQNFKSVSQLSDFAPVMLSDYFDNPARTAVELQTEMALNPLAFKQSARFKAAVRDALRHLIDHEFSRYADNFKALLQAMASYEQGHRSRAGTSTLWQPSQRDKAIDACNVVANKLRALYLVARMLELYPNPQELSYRLYADKLQNTVISAYVDLPLPTIDDPTAQPGAQHQRADSLDILYEMLNPNDPDFSALWRRQHQHDQRDPSIIVHLKALATAVNDPAKWQFKENGVFKVTLASEVFQPSHQDYLRDDSADHAVIVL